jgi:hypothetical protein
MLDFPDLFSLWLPAKLRSLAPLYLKKTASTETLELILEIAPLCPPPTHSEPAASKRMPAFFNSFGTGFHSPGGLVGFLQIY